MSLENLFEQMEVSQGGTGSALFVPGLYRVGLKDIEYIANGHRGTSVKFHFTILESDNPQVAVNTTRTWILKLDKTKTENERALADIKSLVFALSGTSAREVGSAQVNPKAHTQATQVFFAAIDPTLAKKHDVNPKLLIGREAQLEAVNIKTKANTDFTKMNWAPIKNAA